MTLIEIKEELNCKKINFSQVLGEDKALTPWFRAETLDGDFIIIHEEAIGRLQTEPVINTLFLKKRPNQIFHDKETGEITSTHRVFILCIRTDERDVISL